MIRVSDNWERLVRATLDREQLREIALRTPSDLSTISASTSFNVTSDSRSAPSFNLSSLLVEVNSTQFSELEEQLRYMQSFVADESSFKENTFKTILAKLQELLYEVDDLLVDRQIRGDYKKMKGSSSFPLSFSEVSFRMRRKLTDINIEEQFWLRLKLSKLICKLSSAE